MAYEPDWELDGDDPLLMLEDPSITDDTLTDALSHWVAKILEYAGRDPFARKPWNVLIADLWVDSGRVIGHVQVDEEDVGYDTGFRVTADVHRLYEMNDDWVCEHEEAPASDSVAIAHASRLLAAAVQREPAQGALKAAQASKPFTMVIASYGEGPVRDCQTVPF